MDDLLELIEGDLVGDDEIIGDDLDDLLDMVSGDDEIVGDLLDDDEDDEIGARRRRRGGRRSRRVAKLRRRLKAMRRGKGRVSTNRKRGRVLLLGGDATQGAIAGQLQITTTVQELCRVDRLFIQGIDSTGAALNPASYKIADIKVGTSSQFAGLPALPGIMFQADATGQGYALGLDSVQPGTDFTVIIANAPAGSNFTWGSMASALR